MKKRLPDFSAETAQDQVTTLREKRAKPGAGLGLVVLLAVVFWTSIIVFVVEPIFAHE
ncbi:hypothetical protein [Thalassovita sp.]|uniref:hypothetical protein n=1 Tax=Thalassovita sp. TaxID=1979401 RepID=UPI0029DE57E5|nr:hypothetical protein [Thalassovita sp.]